MKSCYFIEEGKRLNLQNIMPVAMNDLRACLICKLIKSTEQWLQNGCENCGEKIFVYKNLECWTTLNFYGFLIIMDQYRSWVSKYKRHEEKVTGVYALEVQGKLK